MTKKKQLHIAIIGIKGYPYVYGGYDTFVKELAPRLVSRGVAVTVYNHRSLFEKKPKYVNGVRLVYTPAIETRQLTQLSHSLISFLHACFSGVDIIFAVNPANGPFALIARLFGKKTVINLDGIEWERPSWKGIASKYFRFASWMATKSYNRLINDSIAMQKVYLEQFGAASQVIAYGANLRFSSNPGLIEKWNLDPGSYYLIVGRMIPDNNTDLIMRGFIASESTKKLVIVGDTIFKDEYAQTLKKLGAKDSRVVFTGYVTDQDQLAELYHNSYMYVHGHEYGGTNPTLLKAMAYGCAVLALDTPFSREVLQGDTFGSYFAKTESSVQEQIERFDLDQATVTHKKSISRDGLTERYQWDHIAGEYIQVFENLLKGYRVPEGESGQSI